MHLFWLGVVLAASPGPDFALITATTIASGRRFGYWTLLGNRASFVLHLFFALAGITAVLARFPALFSSVRLAGALYLIYLGVRWFRTRVAPRGPEAFSGGSRAAFRRGFISNLTNPKVSLFFLSFFPQVIAEEQFGSIPLIPAGIFFLGNASFWLVAIAFLGAAPARRGFLRARAALGIVFGVLFLFLGGRIVWEEIASPLLHGRAPFGSRPAGGAVATGPAVSCRVTGANFSVAVRLPGRGHRGLRHGATGRRRVSEGSRVMPGRPCPSFSRHCKSRTDPTSSSAKSPSRLLTASSSCSSERAGAGRAPSYG